MMLERTYATEAIHHGDLVVFQKRWWVERLFSWPWKPWCAYKCRKVA